MQTLLDNSSEVLYRAELARKKSEPEIARRDRDRLQTVEKALAAFDRAPIEQLGELLRHGVLVSTDRIRGALPRASEREVAGLLARRLELFRGRLVPVISGGGYGVGAGALFDNHPPGEYGKAWTIDAPLHYALTSPNRQLVNQPSKASGWDVASPLNFPNPQVGVLAEQMLLFTGTMTVTPGTGTFTAGWKWPAGIFGAISIQAGGENSLQYGSGPDFRTRVERLFRNPPSGWTAGAGAGSTNGFPGVLASGANAIKVLMPIPIAHDRRTGMGSVYRQDNDLFLTTHIDPPTMAELIVLTGNATAVWSAVNVQLIEFYTTPEKDNQGRIVLPDVSRLFMTSIEDYYFSNNGTVRSAIPRLAGRLLAISHVLDQGNGTVIAPSSLSAIRFKYGANKQPISTLPDDVLAKNRHDYNGLLYGGTGDYYCLDGEVDNPQRDTWIPTGFTEGEVQVDIPGTITPQANSKSHVFFESLVQAIPLEPAVASA